MYNRLQVCLFVTVAVLFFSRPCFTGETTSVLVTGFGPFGGRKINGSWLAAKSLAGKQVGARVTALEIPVVWGEPQRKLETILSKKKPEVLICLGEGYPGFFTVEAVGRNRRKPIKDEKGDLPSTPLNEKNGPAEVTSTAPVLAIARKLTSQGHPTHVSTDAGGYLCDSMLYTIERLKAKHPGIRLVLFVHVPPLGQHVFTRQGVKKATPELIQDFAKALLKTVLTEAR